MQQRTSRCLLQPLVFLPQPPPSNPTLPSRISSWMSLGCPRGCSGTLVGAPFYTALGHCDCCVAGGGTVTWGWHCDMGVTDRAPMRSPAHPPPPSTLRRKPLGCWPRGSRCAQEAQGLSLPLVATLWAQLLGVPDASSATWLQGQTQGCYCSLRPWQKPALQPRDLPYLPSPFCTRADSHEALQ